jgi:hypothetical protein
MLEYNSGGRICKKLNSIVLSQLVTAPADAENTSSLSLTYY